jgi:hypothetical protein
METQSGGAKTVRAMDFSGVDNHDVVASDMLRCAVVIKLHNAGVNLPNVEFLMPMRFKTKPELRMNRIDAST